MGYAPLAFDEQARLARLTGLQLLDAPPNPRLSTLAARALALFPGAETAALSLVAAERVWFKSAYGGNLNDLPREVAFCSHAVLGLHVMVVPDLARDRRFANNPLVTGEPALRFYIGAPLVGGVGTLCVIGKQPQHPTPAQVGGLAQLALLADTQILMQGTLQALQTAQSPDPQPASA